MRVRELPQQQRMPSEKINCNGAQAAGLCPIFTGGGYETEQHAHSLPAYTLSTGRHTGRGFLDRSSGVPRRQKGCGVPYDAAAGGEGTGGRAKIQQTLSDRHRACNRVPVDRTGERRCRTDAGADGAVLGSGMESHMRGNLRAPARRKLKEKADKETPEEPLRRFLIRE